MRNIIIFLAALVLTGCDSFMTVTMSPIVWGVEYIIPADQKETLSQEFPGIYIGNVYQEQLPDGKKSYFKESNSTIWIDVSLLEDDVKLYKALHEEFNNKYLYECDYKNYVRRP